MPTKKKDLTQVSATGRLLKGNLGMGKKDKPKEKQTDQKLASTRQGKGPAKKATGSASLVGKIAKAVTDRSNKKESKAAQVKRLTAVKRLKNKKK